MAYVVKRGCEYLSMQDDESTMWLNEQINAERYATRRQALRAMFRIDWDQSKPDPKILLLVAKRSARDI